MKGLTIKRQELQTLSKEEQYDGIVAFQMVEFSFSVFGDERVSEFHTKIMENGRQFVIDGTGFIPSGFEVLDKQTIN